MNYWKGLFCSRIMETGARPRDIDVRAIKFIIVGLLLWIGGLMIVETKQKVKLE